MKIKRKEEIIKMQWAENVDSSQHNANDDEDWKISNVQQTGVDDE